MKDSPNTVTVGQLLLPVTLISFILCILFAFQLTQIMRERDMLLMSRGQQEQAYTESVKLQTQVSALILGTQQLAEKGNKNAKIITDKLKQIGVIMTPAPESKAPVPMTEGKPVMTPANPPVPTAPLAPAAPVPPKP